jgi:hypothetical protein
MAHSTYEQVLGTIGRHYWQARTLEGEPIPFLFTDPLEGVLWPGDERAATLSPAVEWADAPKGIFSVTIASAMTVGLAPGIYRIQAFCTPTSDGERRCILDESVKFLPTAGSSAAGKSYVTSEDLLDYCPRLEQLQDAETDQAGFAEQRARARTWFDEEVVRNYFPVPGRTRRKVDLSGTGAGPYMAFADPPAGAAVPSDDQLRAMLDADGLVVTDQVRECVAHKAASIVYGGVKSGAYSAEAAQHEGMARRLFYRIEAEIRTDPELASADIRVGRDVIFLT